MVTAITNKRDDTNLNNKFTLTIYFVTQISLTSYIQTGYNGFRVKVPGTWILFIVF
jgi:hypothetical protein